MGGRFHHLLPGYHHVDEMPAGEEGDADYPVLPFLPCRIPPAVGRDAVTEPPPGSPAVAEAGVAGDRASTRSLRPGRTGPRRATRTAAAVKPPMPGRREKRAPTRAGGGSAHSRRDAGADECDAIGLRSSWFGGGGMTTTWGDWIRPQRVGPVQFGRAWWKSGLIRFGVAPLGSSAGCQSDACRPASAPPPRLHRLWGPAPPRLPRLSLNSTFPAHASPVTRDAGGEAFQYTATRGADGARRPGMRCGGSTHPRCVLCRVASQPAGSDPVPVPVPRLSPAQRRAEPSRAEPHDTEEGRLLPREPGVSRCAARGLGSRNLGMESRSPRIAGPRAREGGDEDTVPSSPHHTSPPEATPPAHVPIRPDQLRSTQGVQANQDPSFNVCGTWPCCFPSSTLFYTASSDAEVVEAAYAHLGIFASTPERDVQTELSCTAHGRQVLHLGGTVVPAG
ncbi:unnamed protein product [Diplocarpon coronariae]